MHRIVLELPPSDIEHFTVKKQPVEANYRGKAVLPVSLKFVFVLSHD